tara:strand:+ start:32 stop:271 length:240 start_codon:yes stop_codon:yes gene_type:complete
MNNIFYKLDPKIKVSIKKDLLKYPATTKDLIANLQDAVCWSQLTVGSVQSVINHSHLSFVEISMNDIMWGDKFLTNEKK